MLNTDNHITDELLVKHMLNETSGDEAKHIEQWIQSSETNRKYFGRFQMIWEQSRSVAVISSVNENKAWDDFLQHTLNKKTGNKRRNFRPLKIAASILIVAGSLFAVYLLSGNRQTEQLEKVAIATPVTDTLPDQSIVVLNHHSTISYPSRFNGNLRNIELKGEAFFNIMPDKSKPFIISAGETTIKVIGTSFNVRQRADSIDVIVESGVVEVSMNGKTQKLTANEKISLRAGDTTAAKQKVTDQLHNYYRSKEFICNNTPLWKLIKVLNEAYGTSIIIERDEVKSYPLTTTFENEDLDNILLVISQTFNLRVERAGDTIILK